MGLAALLAVVLLVPTTARAAPPVFQLHVHFDNEKRFGSGDERTAVCEAAQSVVNDVLARIREINAFSQRVAPELEVAAWDVRATASSPSHWPSAKPSWEASARRLRAGGAFDVTSACQSWVAGSLGEFAKKQQGKFWNAAKAASGAERSFYVLFTGDTRSCEDCEVPPELAGQVYVLDPRPAQRAFLAGSADRLVLTDADAVAAEFARDLVKVISPNWTPKGEADGWTACGDVPVGAVSGKVMVLGDFPEPTRGARLLGADGESISSPETHLRELEKLADGRLASHVTVVDLAAIDRLEAGSGAAAFCRWRAGTPPDLSAVQTPKSPDHVFPGDVAVLQVVQPGDASPMWGPLEVVMRRVGSGEVAETRLATRCRTEACEFKLPSSGSWEFALETPTSRGAISEAWRKPGLVRSVEVREAARIVFSLDVENKVCDGDMEPIPPGGEAWFWSLPRQQWCFAATIDVSGLDPAGKPIEEKARGELAAGLVEVRIRKGNEVLAVVEQPGGSPLRRTYAVDLDGLMDRDDITVEIGRKPGKQRRGYEPTIKVDPVTLAFHDYTPYVWGTCAAVLALLSAWFLYAAFRPQDVRVRIHLPNWQVAFERQGRATPTGDPLRGFPQMLGISRLTVRRRWFGLRVELEPRRDFSGDGSRYERSFGRVFRSAVRNPWGPFEIEVSLLPRAVPARPVLKPAQNRTSARSEASA